MKLALVGCGHIGGSLALALREAGVASAVVGHDASPAAAERARARGICDRIAASAAEAAAGADVVVVAVPVRAIPAVCREVAAALPAGAIVTDVGSTKAGVVAGCEAALGGRAPFVGGHPIAGTERAGPDAADGALFRGRLAILTPTPATDPAALGRVAGLWRAAGARVVEMDAAAHDRIFAAVSHLPHVAAYALVGALADRGVDDLLGLTGGGFADSTRIASTPPAMWVDVFLENRDALLPLVDGLVARVAALREAIVAGDGAAIGRLLAEAREARARIVGG